MNTPSPAREEVERQASSRLLEVLIHAGLLGVLVVLCYHVFSPFLSLMVWAVVLAVALYPLHQWLARHAFRKQGLTSTILVIAAIAVLLVPTALVVNSFGDSVRGGIDAVEHNTLKIPKPGEQVKKWPLVGQRLYSLWNEAHEDLPGLVESLQPKFGELERKALSMVGSIGVALLVFLFSLVIAGIIMAYGESASRASRAIFTRILGPARGARMAILATATIRAVAQGILGVAFIEAMIMGLALIATGVPGAGILSMIALVFGIAQVPTILVTLPAIAYYWVSGHYSPTAAVIYTLIVLVSGMIDNVLKPLMLGRGVDAPMPVVLLGALGGMASNGLLGMFVGATLLTLGYQLFMTWVTGSPETGPHRAGSDLPFAA